MALKQYFSPHGSNFHFFLVRKRSKNNKSASRDLCDEKYCLNENRSRKGPEKTPTVHYSLDTFLNQNGQKTVSKNRHARRQEFLRIVCGCPAQSDVVRESISKMKKKRFGIRKLKQDWAKVKEKGTKRMENGAKWSQTRPKWSQRATIIHPKFEFRKNIKNAKTCGSLASEAVRFTERIGLSFFFVTKRKKEKCEARSARWKYCLNENRSRKRAQKVNPPQEVKR